MDLLSVKKEQIEQFLAKNRKAMVNPEYYYGMDNNQDTADMFDDEHFKVLVVFMSTGETRSVSNTFNALYWLVKQGLGEKSFVDNCYFPEDANREVFQKEGIPYLFGNVSHQPITEYDLVICSVAIMPEVFNIPHAWKNSGIPLTVEQRNKENRLPPIIYGGAAANESAIILGKIYDEQGDNIGKSLIDIANYGYGEDVLPEFVKKADEYRRQHNIKDKPAFYEWLISNNVLHNNLFFPQFYEWIYGEDRFTIKEIKKLDDRLPDRVEYHRIGSESFDGFPLKAFHLSGANADSHDIMISSGCSGSSSCCSFCMEATVAGNYHERILQDVEKDMAFVRRNCAPNTISWFSYNLNYYGHFMDLIKTGADYFSGTTLLNERLDIVANAPDQLKLAKQVGLKRFSGAIEGMGDRIRNHILNKNLPRETLMQACRNVYALKLMHMKCGMIATGQETDADIDDFISEIDEMLSIRDEMGANTSLQFNVTPLVFYSQIALRHLPRITARMSYNNERTMAKLIEACQARDIRIKFNGRGCGTWVEQMILDFGPAGTDALVDVTLNEGIHYYRHFGDKDKQRWEKVLAKRGYDPLFFIEARPQDWIFPNDHIIYASDEVKQMWWDRTEKMDFDTRLCLNTLANPNPKCHGCKMCEPKHIPKMVKRDFNDQYSLDEVLEALSDSRHVDSTRIVVRQAQEWDFYNRDSLAHYLAARILQANPELESAFYSVGKHTLSWESNNGQKCWFGGDWAFDINWKTRVSESEITKVIDQINETLTVCKIIRVFGDTKTLPVKRETDIAFLGQTTAYSMSQFKDKLANFDWGIKVATKSMGGGLDTETKYMPELKEKMLLVPHGHSILVYMSVPASVNPYLVMSSILGKGYEKMLQDFSFRVMDHGKEIDGTCKCGRHVTYSLLTGQNKRVCQTCEGKLLLAKMTGQK